MDDITDFLLDLNDEQKKIVISADNLYVTACPGSGKTRVLTRKIAYQSTIYKNSNKKIIAITYTNRATEEIKDRLDLMGVDSQNIWVGTIHQFCLEFIIYPFGMNLPRLSKGFKIIDSYTQREYKDEILANLNIKIKPYEKNDINLSLTREETVIEEKYPNVAGLYHQKLLDNKEIDFGLILLMAYKILKESEIVSKNIARVLRAIYVDEFQDTSEIQYSIIGLLTQANQSIQALFVGDVDQAIYGTLEGVVKTVDELTEITGLSFNVEKISGCYRSTQRIVNYYSEFQQSSYKISSRGANKEIQGIISYINNIHKDNIAIKIANIISYHLSNGIPEKEICIVAPQSFVLFSLGDALQLLLPKSKFDALTISPIKMNDYSIFFKLSILIFTESGIKTRRRKRVAIDILRMLTDEFDILFSNEIIAADLLKMINICKRLSKSEDGVKYFQEVTILLFKELSISEFLYPNIFEEFRSFINETNKRIKQNKLSSSIDNFKKVYHEKKGITLTTAHQVKGEEYNTMIAINMLHGNIPHWKETRKPPDYGAASAKKLIYVICSRAKENLYLISESGYETNNGNKYQPTSLISQYQFSYDK
ncbi:ATP-dependent helicase [Listeria seeligeri]|uniref:UvrD-helicase domain-containing protein n=1 Tax=Listeria seeligeri TaxID=1640 RepID=UPI00188958EC|nr:ATP-dependent helicase [Listeria seeligeri]MBF2481580.1 ATP-dependent helicase [Listeria seeligeri]